MCVVSRIRANGEVVKKGWVEKQSAHLGIWRYRWAVLTETTISFFKDACSYGLQKPTEVLNLSECCATLCISRGARKQCIHFQALHGNGSNRDIFVSIGKDEDELEEWISHLSMHLEVIKVGWVAKQRWTRSHYHEPRWCVLTDKRLYFFKSVSMDFRNPSEVVELAQIETCSAHESDPLSLCINGHSALRSFSLTLSNAEEVEEWRDCAHKLDIPDKHEEVDSNASLVVHEPETIKSVQQGGSRLHSFGFLIFLLIAAVVYVVLPADIVPDSTPLLGWADDAIAVSLILVAGIRHLRMAESSKYQSQSAKKQVSFSLDDSIYSISIHATLKSR